MHFASCGTPLLGDDMYGSKDFSVSRAALHCFSLKFFHPVTKKEMYLEAPLPEDMKRVFDEIE